MIRDALYYANPGQTFVTPDGIIVGHDTLSEAMQKLKSASASTSPIISEPEGQVVAEIEIPPTLAFPFKKIYSWYLTPSAAEKLDRDPLISDFTSERANAYLIDAIPVHRPGEVPID